MLNLDIVSPNRYVNLQSVFLLHMSRADFGLVLIGPHHEKTWERSGSVVVCLTQDRGVSGLSLTGVTALWSLSKTHLS